MLLVQTVCLFFNIYYQLVLYFVSICNHFGLHMLRKERVQHKAHSFFGRVLYDAVMSRGFHFVQVRRTQSVYF